MYTRSKFILVLLPLFFVFLVAPVAAKALPKCFYVASYHKEYDWCVRTERALRKVLEGKCQLSVFYMDTKRNKAADYKRLVGQKAKKLIENSKPDVLITSDDNAIKYLVQPYFKDHKLPVVFFGVNWTVDEYNLPYTNVTGMVEVAPIKPMLQQAEKITHPCSKILYIGADTYTEAKNLERVRKAAHQLGLKLDNILAKTVSEWIEGYRKGQKYDFIVLGSNSGINDWNDEIVRKMIFSESVKLTITNHGWMMPFSMVGFTKIPEEHGEWTGETALAILAGVTPNQIPIISNYKWDLWVNKAILDTAQITLPDRILWKAKREN